MAQIHLLVPREKAIELVQGLVAEGQAYEARFPESEEEVKRFERELIYWSADAARAIGSVVIEAFVRSEFLHQGSREIREAGGSVEDTTGMLQAAARNKVWYLHSLIDHIERKAS